jgi:hypothetical protein
MGDQMISGRRSNSYYSVTMFGVLSSKRPQQVVHLSIDEAAEPADKGHQLVGVLTFHVRTVNGEQHDKGQGYPKPAHVQL